MNNIDVDLLARENVRRLVPYSSARQDYAGPASVRLDANENPYDAAANGLNRYPDPLQRGVKERLAELRGVGPERILLGNGSDEVLDFLFRAFCRPGIDRVLFFTPAYGMYRVLAGVNDVEVCAVPSDRDFLPDVEAALPLLKESTMKLTILCSPNNPVGNLIPRDRLERILHAASGLVVLDEAYIDFAPGESLLPELDRYPNLVVVQTFSKGWGLAGARLGAAFAAPEIVRILNRIRPPYNINALTQNLLPEYLGRHEEVRNRIETIIKERERLADTLQRIPCVLHVHPSRANFLLVRFRRADAVYHALLERGIVVRNMAHGVEGCLRITVGTAEENRLLAEALAPL